MLESKRKETNTFDRKQKCKCCGIDYIAKSNNQKYCSKECSKLAQHLRYHNNKPVSTPKKFSPKICSEGGQTFTPSNAKQLTCSPECAKLRQRKNQKKWDEIRAKRKKNEKNEPTVEKLCPKDCFYRSEITSLISCDYILITGEPRPCGIGKECTVYVRNKKHKERNRPTIVTKDSREDEITSYLVEKMNHNVGIEYRRGNVVSKNGTRRKS